MKRRSYIICMSAILMICMSGMLYASPITQFVMDESNASLVSIIKNQYPSDSIEIFVSKNEFAQNDTLELIGSHKLPIPFTCHVVFADLHPGENWGHECEYLLVSDDERHVSKVSKTMPPKNLLDIFSLYQQGIYAYGDMAMPDFTPDHSRTTMPNKMRKQKSSVNNEKYAVIINGGLNSYNNHRRYWNDCSAMYQTLIDNGYPSRNIYVAMSDGTDPSADMRYGQLYMSSQLDLDGNNTNDIRFAATYNNIQLIFDSLAYRMTDLDDLFIFVTGHGDTINGHSRILLWEEGVLSDTAFARMLNPIYASTTNILMVQNFSGGFIDDVRGREDLIITTACDANEVTHSRADGYFNEFVYHWLAGLNGCSPTYLYPYYIPQFISDYADDNADGYISMEEIYIYAEEHDYADEHPQQESNPACLAQSLTLSELVNYCGSSLAVNGSDLYIKDNTRDRGIEPNTTTEDYWVSDDIWFENNGRRVEHLYSGRTYDVCVRVRNRGNLLYYGNATLYVHWAKSVIGGTWPYGWTDDVLYDCGGSYVQMGEMFGQESIPILDSGTSDVIRIPWTTPESEVYSPCIEFSGDSLSELWHYSILARIVDEDEQPDETTDMDISDFVLGHNNVASRNITVMKLRQIGLAYPTLTSIFGLTNPFILQDSGPFRMLCHVFGDENWDQSDIVRLTFSERFFDNQPHLKWYGCQRNGIDYSFDLSTYSYFDSIYFSYNDISFYPFKLDIIYENTYEPDAFPEVIVEIKLINFNGKMVGGTFFKSRNLRPGLENIIELLPLPAPQRPNNNKIDISDDIYSEIDVYNIHGQHVMHCTNTDIYSLTLPQGIYILRISDENQSYQMKIIK